MGKDAKGKKPHKNKKTSAKYKMYVIDGETIKRKKSCPRCGLGVFLMESNGRLYCGKCHYTDFSKKEESKVEKAPEEKKEE